MSKPRQQPVDLDTLRQRHEAACAPAYAQFLRLVKARGFTTGAGIGVGYGGLCAALLEYRGIDKLIGIDPYTHRPGYHDPTNLSPSDMGRVHAHALDRLARFGGRFELLREYSADAAAMVPDNSLDFIYIDGDHRHASVLGNLGAWYPKVRVGGVIAGRDYDNRDQPGVQHAVDGFFQRLGWPVNDPGAGAWWVQKRPTPISYVIPAYNAEATLWQAAASIFEDNLAEGDELIIVDDGSTDATSQVIDALAEACPKARVIRNDRNRGAGSARNRGVAAASHDLIYMLDADNILPSDAVGPLRDDLICSNVNAATFHEARLFRDGEDHRRHAWTHTYTDRVVTMTQYCRMTDPAGAAGGLLFTREAWERAGGYPEHAGALDSWGFGLRLTATGSTIGVCPHGYYYHRIGHAGYWEREHRPGKTDRLAFSILRPYFHRLAAESQFYLLHAENQERWFTELPKRPLRLDGDRGAGLLQGMGLNLATIRSTLARLTGRAA